MKEKGVSTMTKRIVAIVLTLIGGCALGTYGVFAWVDEEDEGEAIKSSIISEVQVFEDKPTAPTPETIAIMETTGLDQKSVELVYSYAKEFELEPSLLLAMMKVESGFNSTAVGKSKDRGYFQIIPPSEKAIANNWGYKVGLTYDPSRIFEPEYNIGLAVAYIDELRRKYNTDYHRILSEYNRGPGKLKSYYEQNGTYVTEYSNKVMRAEAKYANII